MSVPQYVSRVRNGIWRLQIWVQPRAKKDEIAGTYQQSLKIRITAPPVDDKANGAILAFLARRLGLKPRQLSIESGHASRSKSILIESDTQPSWDVLESAR